MRTPKISPLLCITISWESPEEGSKLKSKKSSGPVTVTLDRDDNVAAAVDQGKANTFRAWVKIYDAELENNDGVWVYKKTNPTQTLLKATLQGQITSITYGPLSSGNHVIVEVIAVLTTDDEDRNTSVSFGITA